MATGAGIRLRRSLPWLAGLLPTALVACLIGVPEPESAPDGADAQAADDATVEGGVDAPTGDAPDEQGDSAPLSYAQRVEDDGAIAYWRLGELSGTTAKEEIDSRTGAYVGSGNSLGQNGAIKYDKNTSVLFDGTGHVSVQGDAFFDTSAPFSMEVWIKPAQAPDTSNRWVLGVHDQTNLNAVTLKYWYMQTLDVTVVRNDAGTSVPVNGSANPYAWNHLVLTFDGTSLTFYLNGNAASSVPVVGTESDAGPREIVFGGVGNGGFVGYVDEVALYAKALTPATVQAHCAYGDLSIPKDAGADAADAAVPDARSPTDARPDG